MAEQGPYRKLATTLLDWYDRSGRTLPWRVKGGRQEPYKVWLSEIMLQQTTVAAVKDYYARFLARWPDVHGLAAADREDVMRMWAGLGYYARARNLHACAQVVSIELRGKFPDTFEGLMALPGVGPYTAAAIAAIAFDVPAAAVDGNVERVVSRLHAVTEPLPASKLRLRGLAQALVPEERAGDFAQAVMDLGATVCTPRNPNCLICPWTDQCAARAQGIAGTLPRKAAKKAIPTRRGYAYVVRRPDGAVLLRRRPERGLLGGMMEVPGSPWDTELPPHAHTHAPLQAAWRIVLAPVLHTFTHFQLELTVLVAEAEEAAEGVWVAAIDVQHQALPAVMRKVLAAA
jgi:A/G-specific adenine glycosylase